MPQEQEPWVRRFYDDYTDAYADNRKIQDALNERRRHFPSVLYKFRGVNNFTLNEITTGQLWLAKAEGQPSDPNDTSLTYDEVRVGRELFRSNANRFALQRLGRPYSEEEAARIRDSEDPFQAFLEIKFAPNPDTLAKANDPRVRDLVRGKEAEIREFFSRATQVGTYISCFCAVSDDVRMWTEFATGGAGFCFVFNVAEIDVEILRIRLFPILYDSARADITDVFLAKIENPLRFNRGALKATLRKHPDHAHEREWRIVDFQGRRLEAGGFPFDMPKPTKIILGPSTGATDEVEVRRRAAERGIPVERFARPGQRGSSEGLARAEDHDRMALKALLRPRSSE